MKRVFLVQLLSLFFVLAHTQTLQQDIIPTSKGDLKITFIAHGTLMLEYNNVVIHVDPVGMFGTDYSKLPKADIILITHSHPDHLDAKTVALLRKENTAVLIAGDCAKTIDYGEVMANGDHKTVAGISIDAVPAYNLTTANHPKGVGNGYVLVFGDKKVYIAGDTENIPEMSNLKDISVAFLPMNKPYTMDPAQVAEAARVLHPAILYPYHYGQTDTNQLIDLLKNDKGIEVRIRNLN
jgi:L-ascorbate metabolism protein UlaG (beta-lactamase superfamily)